MLESIPGWFWLVFIGVAGQSFCGFFFAHRKKIAAADHHVHVKWQLLAALMHGLGAAALVATMHYGVTAMFLGIAFLVISVYPMRWAVESLE